MNKEKEEIIRIPLEWHFPENIKSSYATNMLVQHGENEFTISFFEVIPPVALGSPEERFQQLKNIDSIKAECVARIIVAADKMPSIIEALQDNFEKYQLRMAELKGDEQ